jgi:hypothetical protein
LLQRRWEKGAEVKALFGRPVFCGAAVFDSYILCRGRREFGRRVWENVRK